MRIITQKELNKIIENHQHWLKEDCYGWEEMRADLRGADLRGAYLRGADLKGADLRWADLRYAYLEGADLSNTVLVGTDLRDADLRGANLEGTDLRWADLEGTDLYGADLRWADLKWADLRGAYLKDAKLDENEKIRKGMILTESIVGYKKCKDDAIVELEIPAGAIVFSINNNKCRTNKAIVKSIIDNHGNKINRAYSKHKFFSYYVGDVINIKDFNMAYNVECATGIHFFRNIEDAESY